jgi:hypothetical protein
MTVQLSLDMLDLLGQKQMGWPVGTRQTMRNSSLRLLDYPTTLRHHEKQQLKALRLSWVEPRQVGTNWRCHRIRLHYLDMVAYENKSVNWGP